MKYITPIFLFLILNIYPVQGGDYFIRLTKSGLLHKEELLNANAAAVANIARPAQLSIYKTISHSRAALRFERWLQVSSVSSEAEKYIEQLKDQQLIDYAEPVGVFQLKPENGAVQQRTVKGEGTSGGLEEGDSLLAKQWYLNKINAFRAWEINSGSPEIIVGVIDTGIDYKHPNLKGSIWINRPEANGLPGVDDDGNGFIDDSLGWDFTDAPRFADGGDYKDPDNDPMDEYGNGHGTQVAGIIAARRTAGQGISGVAPGVRIMNLRAGTASGYLEEDDVARAIIYALDKGARIVNMSFGDVVLSRFLRDVIYYAYKQGMVLVASSGNSGDDQVHYPSALNETISVGATNKNDYVTGFSTYGSSLDLVAPGAEIFSTAIGGGYNEVNGTSFSAPVVSAIAALVLSQNPQYSVEQVRNVLKTSCKDIYAGGWDQYSAAGRADALQALRVQNSGVLNISSPAAYASTAEDTLWLKGSLMHPDLLSWSVAIGIGEAPQQWQSVCEFQRRQVFQDTLAAVPLSTLADTLITIRVQMRLVNGGSDEIRRVVAVDHTPPQISNMQVLHMYDGFLNSCLISFESDDVCRARLFLRAQGDSAFSEVLESVYETKSQRFKLDSDQYSGNYQFYVQAENYSGLSTIEDNNGSFYHFTLESDFEWQEFIPLERSLHGGYFLDKSLDLDGDGNKEIIVSTYDDDWNFGPVCIYEFEGGQFVKRLETAFTAIPRDAGDVDGDGKSDMLLGYGNRSFLFEAKDEHSFPTELVWFDTTEFWAAGYSDVDSDGKQEIVGRVDSAYVLLETSADNRFVQIASLGNPTEGANQYGMPKILQADLNNDGRQEIIFGDSDGDILIYTALSDNHFDLLTSARTHLPDATAMLTVSDMPQGLPVLFSASHTADDLANENEFDARHWALERFRYDPGKTELISRDTLNFYGYRSLRDFDSGLKAARFGDETFLFSACYPHLHVFKVEQDKMTLVWQRDQIRSNAVLIDDFDKDGNPEFYVNTGKEIVAYTANRVDRPSAPYPFSAVPLDSQRILLHWTAVSGAQNYGLYRGFSADSLTRRALLKGTTYTDTCLDISRTCFYAVTAIDSSFALSESAFSQRDSAKTSMPPRLLAVQQASDRQLILQFNEAVKIISGKPFRISRAADRQRATSAILLKDQHKILCGFGAPFTAGMRDTIFVDGVFDLDNVPIDARYNRLKIIYAAPQKEPFVQEVSLPDRYSVRITFSEPMREEDLLNKENYRLSPSGFVEQVLLRDSSYRAIEIHLSREAMAGALGKPAYLELENIHSLRGVSIKNTGKINLFTEMIDLNRVRLYPQPVRPGHTELIFANLPQNVKIQIFNLQGLLVKSIRQQTNYGAVRWNLKDDLGKRVHSGIYLYRISDYKQEKTGKLVIIR